MLSNTLLEKREEEEIRRGNCHVIKWTEKSENILYNQICTQLYLLVRIKWFGVDMPHGGNADRWICRPVDIPTVDMPHHVLTNRIPNKELIKLNYRVN